MVGYIGFYQFMMENRQLINYTSILCILFDIQAILLNDKAMRLRNTQLVSRTDGKYVNFHH